MFIFLVILASILLDSFKIFNENGCIIKKSMSSKMVIENKGFEVTISGQFLKTKNIIGGALCA